MKDFKDWPDDWRWWWLLVVGYILLAAVAGGLGYAQRRLDAGARLSVWRVLFEMACSAFAGGLVLMLCLAMGLPPLWTGMIVGVFGWLGGSAAMKYLERIGVRKLGGD